MAATFAPLARHVAMDAPCAGPDIPTLYAEEGLPSCRAGHSSPTSMTAAHSPSGVRTFVVRATASWRYTTHRSRPIGSGSVVTTLSNRCACARRGDCAHRGHGTGTLPIAVTGAGYPALVPRSVRIRTSTEFALQMGSDGDLDDASDGDNPSRHTLSLTVGSEPATEQRADHAQHEGAHDSEAPEANDGVRHALMYEPDPAIHGAE